MAKASYKISKTNAHPLMQSYCTPARRRFGDECPPCYTAQVVLLAFHAHFLPAVFAPPAL
jgi:hypothetical protein